LDRTAGARADASPADVGTAAPLAASDTPPASATAAVAHRTAADARKPPTSSQYEETTPKSCV
jgi:hypothetical protein